MKTVSPIYFIMFFSFLLISCSSNMHPSLQTASNFINKQSVTTSTKQTYAAKNPNKVTVFSQNQTPHTAYRIIGVAKVSKYNLVGGLRQEATLHAMMKKLAASVGGDGLIDVKTTKETMQANIIQFQKILI